MTDNAARNRFEAYSGDHLVGFVDYRQTPQALVLTHAETDPARRGQGIGTRLILGTLDEIRRRDESTRIVPRCPFVADVIDRNPEYADLVAS